MNASPGDAQPPSALASPQAAASDQHYNPALSFDVMADASALVRACIAGDGQDVIAVAGRQRRMNTEACGHRPHLPGRRTT